MLNAIEDGLFCEVKLIKLMLKSQGMVAVEEFLNKNNVAVIEAFYPGMEGLRRQLIAAEMLTTGLVVLTLSPQSPSYQIRSSHFFTRINIILL